MAPSDYPGHELHGKPYRDVVRNVPAVPHMRSGKLPVHADASALYARATSFPLVAAVVGPMFILPNVGLNEWGHAFWLVDEMFAAPLHWGFVSWVVRRRRGRGGTDCLAHVGLGGCDLNNAPKSILDPFSSQLTASTARGY